MHTTLIAAAELRAMRPAVVIFDCRFDLANPAAGRAAYLGGHVPGAHYADLNADLAAPVGAASGRHPLPSPAALARFLANHGVREDTQVVAYDEANGAFAARLWWLLRWLGHDAVAVLDGGLEAWVASGGELETGARDPSGRVPIPAFSVRLRARLALTTAQVQAALRDPERLLIDARAPDRYAGRTEPLDPVAGHVPGAVNQPFTDNLDPKARFLPAAELKSHWLARLGEAAPENAIMMCGSGVTACHNLLAMEIAGLPGATLYGGSWSEWIRDPSRPIACGEST